LNTNHKQLKDKPKELFAAKLKCFKSMKPNTTGPFQQDTAKLVEASHELSLLSAKAKNAWMFGEILVKLCLLTTRKVMLGIKSQRSYKKFCFLITQ
jgi:hypothetical protein